MSDSWDKRVSQIRSRIDKEGTADFLSWPVVVGTMYVGNGRVIEGEEREVHGLVPPEADPNMIHQLYHLYKWETETGLSSADIASVVEIGGGYGSMYHLWRLRGFTGEYQMYDYPEVLELQNAYLSKNGVEPPVPASLPLKADLLIACFSLTEMTESEREALLVGAEFNHFLVAYAPRWDGINNEQYLESWGGTRLSSPHLKSGVYRFG